MWEALRLASVNSFISELPDGLDTVVGDREIRLWAANDSVLCWRGRSSEDQPFLF